MNTSTPAAADSESINSPSPEPSWVQVAAPNSVAQLPPADLSTSSLQELPSRQRTFCEPVIPSQSVDLPFRQHSLYEPEYPSQSAGPRSKSPTLTEHVRKQAVELDGLSSLNQWLSSGSHLDSWSSLTHQLHTDVATVDRASAPLPEAALVLKSSSEASTRGNTTTEQASESGSWTLLGDIPSPAKEKDHNDVCYVGAAVEVSEGTNDTSMCWTLLASLSLSYVIEQSSGSSDLVKYVKDRLVYEAFKAVYFTPAGCYRSYAGGSGSSRGTPRSLAPANSSSLQKRRSEISNDDSAAAAEDSVTGGRTKRRKILSRDPGEACREFACLHCKNDARRWHRCRGWSCKDIDNVVRVSLSTHDRPC